MPLIPLLMFAALITFLFGKKSAAVPVSSSFSLEAMKVKAFQVIAKFETFIPKSIWDYKQYSYGYGSKAQYAGQTITEPQAAKLLQDYVLGLYISTKPHVKVHLNTNQWAALLSFVYNLGLAGSLKMISHINTLDKKLISSKWVQYNRAGGKVLNGLTQRRKQELALFYS